MALALYQPLTGCNKSVSSQPYKVVIIKKKIKTQIVHCALNIKVSSTSRDRNNIFAPQLI